MSSLERNDFAVRLADRLPHLRRIWEPDRRLADLALDSLDTVELLMVVDELYGVRLTADDLKQTATVGEFCSLVAARAAEMAVISAKPNR